MTKLEVYRKLRGILDDFLRENDTSEPPLDELADDYAELNQELARLGEY